MTTPDHVDHDDIAARTQVRDTERFRRGLLLVLGTGLGVFVAAVALRLTGLPMFHRTIIWCILFFAAIIALQVVGQRRNVLWGPQLMQRGITDRQLLQLLGTQFAATVLIAASFFVSFGFRDMLGSMSLMILMVLAAPAATMLWFGLSGRRPAPASCAKCHYRLAPDPRDRPPRCPECGEEVDLPDAVVYSVPARRPAFVISGGILLALVLLVGLPFLQPSLAAPAVPTAVLLRVAPTSDSLWAELERRGIPPEAEADVARRLLNARRDAGYFRHPGLAWVESLRKSGRLPADLTERYFAETTKISLRTPDRARAGQPVTISFAGDARDLGFDAEPHFFVEISVDGQVVLRTDQGIPSFYLDDSLDQLFGIGGTLTPPGGGPAIPEFTTTPAAAGPMRVRVRVIRAVFPDFHPYRVNWLPDGSYEIDPAALWHDEIVLEKTIHVR